MRLLVKVLQQLIELLINLLENGLKDGDALLIFILLHHLIVGFAQFAFRSHDGVEAFAALVSCVGSEFHSSGELKDVFDLRFVDVVAELFQVLHLCVDGGPFGVELCYHLFEYGVGDGSRVASGNFDGWVGWSYEVSPEMIEHLGSDLLEDQRGKCLLLEFD